MHHRVRPLAAAVATILAGCGSDSTSAPPSQGNPADAAVIDAAQDTSDAAPDQPDAAQDASPDAPSDALADTTGPDSSVDAAGQDGPPDAADDAPQYDATADGTEAGDVRPAGQCRSDGDCGPGQTCTMTAPGGLCAGCGTADDCPDPLAFECFMGTCQRTCSEDTDCPAGYECKSVGRCGLIACSGSCPPPYVCSGGFCRRPACSGTPPECPAGMTCGQDDVCVEP
jgi:hypothetical protein